MRTKLLFVTLAVVSALGGPAAAAASAPPAPGHHAGLARHGVRAASADPTVTLDASPTKLSYGDSVRFTGAISPAAGGETVDIVDRQANTIAQATTKADGTYRASAVPKQSLTVHAQWTTASSGPVHLRVRPILTGSRTPLRLFDRVKVRGRLSPATAARKVEVLLSHGGAVIAHGEAKVRSTGRYRTTLPVGHVGTQRVVVLFRSPSFAPASWRSKPGTPPTPPLHEGSKGIFVKLLQTRLAQLHYKVAARDGDFDARTADSVMAFHKAQGMARTQSVDLSTWRALAAPKRPKARDHSKGYHWEVDLTKQLLYYVHDGTIVDILHVSTGKPSTPTRPGMFHVDFKEPGFNRKQMYYSSFFDGNRALHGYADVPSYAASHGCVRIPMWNAIWTYDRAPIGILVYVY